MPRNGQINNLSIRIVYIHLFSNFLSIHNIYTMDQETFDRFLGTVARNTRSIEELLKLFLSFLHRKSDFFIVDPNPRRKMGFAEGQAEEIVCKSMLTRYK